jgi:hypothetical protein
MNDEVMLVRNKEGRKGERKKKRIKERRKL